MRDRIDLLWIVLSFVLVVLECSCAGVVQRPVAASLPSSQPASQPEIVCIPRSELNELAVKMFTLDADKNVALSQCTEKLTLKTAQDDAAQAVVRKQDFQIKAMAIGGSAIAIVGPITAAIITKYAEGPSTIPVKAALVRVRREFPVLQLRMEW